ncbi:hypothetical protein FHY09_003068 [Xanthomonas sp. 60]
MATGQNIGGVRFEDYFDPDVMGDGPTAPGFRGDDGQLLRFAHIRYGSKGPDVGRRGADGRDLSNNWAARGTARYALDFNGGSYSSEAQAPTSATGPVTASLSVSLLSNGTWQILRSASNSSVGNGTDVLASGSWLPAGHTVADYQVQFSGAVQGAGSLTNSAPSFADLGTSRSANLTVSVPAASSQSLTGAVDLLCELRRLSTGAVTRTACRLTCKATGWH